MASKSVARHVLFCKSVCIIAFLLSVTQAPAFAQGQQVATVKLWSLPGHNLPLISCTIDGTPGFCLLDTGAEVSFVLPGVVKKISRRTYDITTENRETKLHGAIADVSVEGQNVIHGVVLLVGPMPRGAKFQAILGENFLRTFNRVTLDYSKQIVELEK